MLIVPDDILEELTCDFCYKYLSVGPVKVNTGRKKKCGRCALNNDGNEVTSVFKHFGESAIFKCINRFDGCEELLTYSEVINHEKQCLSKKYECPFCEDGVEIETYQLIYHFKKQHHRNYLKKSILTKKLDEIQTVNKFVYLKDNFVFLIYVEFEAKAGTLFFNAYHIGGKNEYDVQQKCYVNISGMKTYETNQMKCLPLQNIHNIDWRLKSNKINDILQNEYVVIFYFEFDVPSTTSNQIVIAKNKSQTISSNIGLTIPMGVRYIYVNKEKEEDFIISDWSISPCRQKLLVMTSQEEIELKIDCNLCSNFSIDNKYYITQSGSSRQLTCLWCVKCRKSSGSTIIGGLLASNHVIELTQYFKYSCIWNCGELYSLRQIQTHELSCEKNPGIKCPYDNCYFKNVFEEMKKHLLDEHGEFLFFKHVHIDQSQGFYINTFTVPMHGRPNVGFKHYVLTSSNDLLSCVYTNNRYYEIQVEHTDKSEHVRKIFIGIPSDSAGYANVFEVKKKRSLNRYFIFTIPVVFLYQTIIILKMFDVRRLKI